MACEMPWQVCANQACQAKQAMQLVHNRSKFSDKQIVRIQEAPEHIPEGDTPVTCSMQKRRAFTIARLRASASSFSTTAWPVASTQSEAKPT